MPLALLGPIGWPELVIILFIVLIVFGPRRLPDVAEALGKSISKFKRATRDARDEIESGLNESKLNESKKKDE